MSEQRQDRPLHQEQQPVSSDAAPPIQLRDTTRNLLEAAWLDSWPRAGAIVDFGIDSQEHYEALCYGIREGEITPEALDAALGHGEKLTTLARSAPSNPHCEITFSTSWDVVLGRTGSGEPGPESEPELDEDLPLVGEKAEAIYAEWREDHAARVRETAGPQSWQVWHQLGYPQNRVAEIVGISDQVFPRDFVLVATVPASSPHEAVYLTTNTGDNLEGPYASWERNPGVVAHVAIPRSTDAGDVVVDPKGYAFRVEPDGFRRIGDPALSSSEIAERLLQVERGSDKNHDRNHDR